MSCGMSRKYQFKLYILQTLINMIDPTIPLPYICIADFVYPYTQKDNINCMLIRCDRNKFTEKGKRSVGQWNQLPRKKQKRPLH